MREVMLGPIPKKDCRAEERSRRSGKLREKRKTMVKNGREEGRSRPEGRGLEVLNEVVMSKGWGWYWRCCLKFDCEAADPK